MRVAEIVREAKVGSVPHAWIGITNRMDPAALLTLRTAVVQKNVDPSDAAAVKGVWDTLVSDAQARAQTLKDEAAKDRQEYEARVAARSEELDRLRVIARGQPKG